MTDPVRRVRYFAGQVLGPEDFETEQDYHRRMRYLHNRLLGHGVVEGLEVSAGDGTTVVVTPGVAIDRLGREIVLVDPVQLDVSACTSDGPVDVVAAWAEEPDGYVASAVEECEEPAFTRWLERPHVSLDPPEESPHDAVVLGRVRLKGGSVAAVDHSSRHVWRAPHGHHGH